MGHIPAALGLVLAIVYVAAAVVAAVHALLTKPDPRSALGWIGVCWLFPLAGPVLYGLFGVNRVRTRARQLRAGSTDMRTAAMKASVEAPPDGFSGQLAHIGDAVTQRTRLPGNDVDLLENGENAFPAMLDAIAQATLGVSLAQIESAMK